MSLRAGLGVAASLPLYLVLALYYIETYKELTLPAPSFKNIAAIPQANPLAEHKGVFAHNGALRKAVIHFKDKILGSESVIVSKDGELYMLDKYGIIWRGSAKRSTGPQRLARLGAGRPLGFHVDQAGNLVICNSPAGLQLWEKDSGTITLLAREAPANASDSSLLTPIQYANDLDIASDGTIYFTDSTVIPSAINAGGFYDTMASYMLDLLQGDKTGRLLKYDPRTKSTSFLAGGLHYANGIVLGPNEEFALVVETSSTKVTKVWLRGPKAGQQETFISHIPGYPDGLTKGSEGSYWLSLVVLRNPALELLIKTRITRWLVPRLPASLRKTRSGTAVIQFSAEGKVLRYLDDPDGSRVASVSSVTETPDGLYLGNLGGNFVSFLHKADWPQPIPS